MPDKSGRTIRCSITMDMVETEHFNPTGWPVSDEWALRTARESFAETILYRLNINEDLSDLITATIVEDGNA